MIDICLLNYQHLKSLVQFFTFIVVNQFDRLIADFSYFASFLVKLNFTYRCMHIHV